MTWVGPLNFQGITKAGFSQFNVQLVTGLPTVIRIFGSNSGSGLSSVAAADVPSGGTVSLRFSLTYRY
jgi:hypothetical protein